MHKHMFILYNYNHIIIVNYVLYIYVLILRVMLPNSLTASRSSCAASHDISSCVFPGSSSLLMDVANVSALSLRDPRDSSLSTTRTSVLAIAAVDSSNNSSSSRLMLQTFILTVVVVSIAANSLKVWTVEPPPSIYRLKGSQDV